MVLPKNGSETGLNLRKIYKGASKVSHFVRIFPSGILSCGNSTRVYLLDLLSNIVQYFGRTRYCHLAARLLHLLGTFLMIDDIQKLIFTGRRLHSTPK